MLKEQSSNVANRMYNTVGVLSCDKYSEIFGGIECGDFNDNNYSIEFLSELQKNLFYYDIPQCYDCSKISNVLLELLECADEKVVRYAILCIANVYTSYSNNKLKNNLIEKGLCERIYKTMVKWNEKVYPSIIIVLSKMVSFDEYRNYVIEVFKFEKIFNLFLLCLNIKETVPYCKLLLKNITRNMVQNPMELLEILLNNVSEIPLWCLEYIGYLGQWIDNYVEIIHNYDICQIANWCIQQSNDVDEIRASIIFLGYAQYDSIDIISNLLQSDNNDISASALWYLSRYLKYKKENGLNNFNNSIIFQIIDNNFENARFQKQTECIYCLCYLFQYSSPETILNNIQELNKIITFLTIDVPTPLLFLILKTISILLLNDNDIFNFTIQNYLKQLDFYSVLYELEQNETYQIAILSTNIMQYFQN